MAYRNWASGVWANGVWASGVWAETSSTYTLTASPGTTVLTGTSANVWWGRKVVGAVGTAVTTASAAALLWSRKLLGLSGTAETTGVSAVLNYSGNPGASPEARKARFLLMGVMKLWWIVLVWRETL